MAADSTFVRAPRSPAAWHPVACRASTAWEDAQSPAAAGGANPGPAAGPAAPLRERFGALRNLPPFLKLSGRPARASPSPTSRCRLVRAFLPVATLYVGKLIIDEVVRLAAAGRRAGDACASGCQRPRDHLLAPPRPRVRARRPLRRAGPRRLARRLAALRALHERDQHPADGARGDARPRGLRGQRAAGPARARAPPDHGAHDAHDPAPRPGAGRRHHRELRRRPRRLRAVAHRAAPARARPRVPRRGALQRAELLAQLRAHAGAPRARLRAPDRGQRRDGEGSEDLRPERVPHRALPRRSPSASTRANRTLAVRRAGWGGAPHRDRHARLLRRLRLHRLAHAARRLHHRRPDLPLGLLPPPAQPARGAAHRLLAGGRTGALPRRPLLVLRDRAGDRLARRTRGRSRSRSARASASRTSASAIRARSAGRCAT